MVSEELQDEVRQVVIDSVERVQAHYPNEVFPPILITYERSYTTAGWAKCLQYQVNFDPILLVANRNEFLKQIVPHEVAHILAEHIHGHDIAPHGQEWKDMMILLGLSPDRCHKLDTSISKRKFTTYKFACGCKEIHEYGSVMAKKILQSGQYACVECLIKLRPVDPIVFPPHMPRRIALGTKKDKAEWIVRRNRGRTRKTVIRKLIQDAGLTPAGASTYYQNLTK